MNPSALLPLCGVALVLSAGPLAAKTVRHGGAAASSKTHPQPPAGDDAQTAHFEFKHVNFHIDETVVLQIALLRGELLPAKEGKPPSFDDRDSMLLKIDGGEAAMSTASFATLMNRYVFNYRGTPLTNVRVSPEGDQLHMTATLNKTVNTEMTGTLNATADGRIHFHPTSIKTAGIPAKGLMDALGLKMDKLVKGTDPRGVDVAGDDIIMDLDRLLPPPRVRAHVTGVRMEGSRVDMTFGPATPADAPKELTPPVADTNYMYLRGGTVSFAKLTMVNSDMEFVDAHPEDALDFSLSHYYEQLVAGSVKNTPAPAKGLVATIPDYRQLGEHPATPTATDKTP